MARRLISSGSPLEKIAGYSRAVVEGDFVFVAGTTGYDPSTKAMPADAGAQAQALKQFIASKGSVAFDGISLTINEVEDDVFGVIIPHTWTVTTLGARKAGDRLNMEVDMLARYVARILGKDAA